MTFSERSFIAGLAAKNVVHSDKLLVGIGDDCAVYQSSSCATDPLTLVTADALVEGVHFDLTWHPPELLGRKALAVNLSDIAAMGGKPLYALLSIGVSGAASSFADQFMAGFKQCLAEHKVSLIGGDTVKSSCFFASITLIGEVQKEHLLLRSGAQPGDEIWVTGSLGEAAAGLALCRRGMVADTRFADLVQVHLDPLPVVAGGQALAQSGFVSAMMDLSDGVATDLAHLCSQSGVGAHIEAERIPVSSQALLAATELHASALEWALRGGEDYQLLFTAAPEHTLSLRALAEKRKGCALHSIGRIVKGSGVSLLRNGTVEPIEYSGYEHLA